jgi:hypothetical protein
MLLVLPVGSIIKYHTDEKPAEMCCSVGFTNQCQDEAFVVMIQL